MSQSRKMLITILIVAVIIVIIVGVATTYVYYMAQPKEQPTVPTGPVEIVMWDGLTGGDGYVMEMLIEEFNNEHEGKIVVKETHILWAELYTKLTAAYQAGTGLPDVLIMHNTEVAQFMDTAIKPITDYFYDQEVGIADLESDFFDMAMKWVKKGDEIYGVPWDVHCYSLYVNLDVLDKANLTLKDVSNYVARGIDGFKELIELIEERNATEWGFTVPAYSAYPGLPWHFPCFVPGLDPIITSDGVTATVNDERHMTAWSFYEWLVTRPKSIPLPGSMADYMDYFITGRVGMIIAGTWYQATFDQYPQLRYIAVTAWPGLWGQSHIWFMTRANGKERDDAAWTLIKWMVSRVSNMGRWGQYAGHVPARRSAANYPPYSSLPGRINQMKQIFDVGVKFYPPHPRVHEIESIIGTYVQKILYRQMTAEEAANAAQEEIQALLNETPYPYSP
ncbi:MAG: extracellular solute-binding protein [Candidatus Bathyarchaeia archaeon]